MPHGSDYIMLHNQNVLPSDGSGQLRLRMGWEAVHAFFRLDRSEGVSGILRNTRIRGARLLFRTFEEFQALLNVPLRRMPLRRMLVQIKR